MAAHQVNITDRAKRYRAQNNVTGPRKCVLCGSRSDLGVMHLTGNEDHGERENLAYGCRSCNGKLAAAYKTLNLGKPTNQYNPAKSGVPTFEQYMWAVSNHSRGAHDAGGAVIHATPKHKRIEYARRIVSKAQQTKRDRLDDRWNPGKRKGKKWGENIVFYNGSDQELAHEALKRALIGGYVGVQKKRYKGEWYVTAESARSTENPWPFSRPDARRTTPAHGGIAFHQGKMKGKAAPAKRKAVKEAGGGAMPDEATLQAGFKRGLSLREILAANPALAAFKKSNPAKFARCVKAVRRNPASASAEVFEEFHGFAPSETITVTKKIHYHKHLAAAGALTHLDVWGIDGAGHKISGFKGAFLAFNEKKNQLFVEGGDQAIDLEDFGIDSPHELETLGRLTDIGYQTNKTHLGDEGGEAVYVHKFRATNRNGKHVIVKIARYPDLIYDVRNEQLLFSGGSYEILREGINK